MGRKTVVHVYIDVELREKAARYGFNMSKMLEEAIREALSRVEKGVRRPLKEEETLPPGCIEKRSFPNEEAYYFKERKYAETFYNPRLGHTFVQLADGTYCVVVPKRSMGLTR